ncbi:MAG TPA: hypothetical protein VLG39_05435 [Nitrospirota bacterium]|nr:hypothetical protein [Nitrospirota bacterium]
MNKECEETRKNLPKYLQGHVFRTRRGRIERHLDQCVICRSEFEALRRTEETREILRDIDAPGGVVGRVKDGVFALGKIRKLLYRPLWIAAILLAASAVVYYLVTPHQLAREIDSIVKSEPTPSTPAATPHAPPTPANAAKPDAPAAPATVTRPSATAERPLPVASAVKSKTRPRPATTPSAPRRAHELVTTPSETAAPASGQPLPGASAANPQATSRPAKSSSAPRPAHELATSPSETAAPASPVPGPSQ